MAGARRVGSRWTVPVLACLLLIAFPSSQPKADEAASEAADTVHALAAEIFSIRDQGRDASWRRRALAHAIEARTDVPLLSRLVLGKHWRSLDDAVRRDYTSLFSTVIIGGLGHRLDGILSQLQGTMEQHFTIISSKAAGKRDVIVRSSVILGAGETLAVDWRLREHGNGPVLIDLVIEGISLLVSQRAEFAAVIERHRIDGLIDGLRRRAEAGDF